MAGPRIWRQQSLAPSRGLAAAMFVAALAAGCKSGTWGAKPSWWSFGGATPETSLAAAPEFNKDVTKPSEAAKPYPTTDTPESYSLAGGDQPSTPGGGPSLEPTSITYGSTPPPAETAPQAVAQPSGQVAAPATAQPGGIGPQVGPYASLEPAAASPAVDPAAAATAGLAAAPAFGEATPPAGSRVADARGSNAWAAAPPSNPSDSRYGTVTGSRFSGGFQPGAAEPVPATAPFTQPAAAAFPPAAVPPAAPPAAPIVPTPSATTPAAGSTLPGTITPPSRRPDPGYRPGGTSSYRPSRSILAEDEAAGGGVMPVSFEAAAAGGQ